jgi:hypothetical protein
MPHLIKTQTGRQARRETIKLEVLELKSKYQKKNLLKVQQVP